MRSAVVLVIISLLSLAPGKLAAAGPLPICAGHEFRSAFHLVVEHQLLLDENASTAEELAEISESALAMRQDLGQLPLCADAIVISRLFIQLGGDYLARAALDLAGLPAADNPYFALLPDDQTRIEDRLAAMLAIDRSGAPPADQRASPACEAEDWRLLDDAIAAFLELAEAPKDEPELEAIDQLLRWREADLPALPDCAHSIDLLHALNAAATDSAANQAFTYGGLPREGNPFPPLLEASLAAISGWQAAHSQAGPSGSAWSAADRPGAESLPPCAPADLAAAADMRSEYAALMEGAETAADPEAFGNDQIAFRDARLSSLPDCAEAFALRWWLAEDLADAALLGALESGAQASIGQGPREAIADNEARLSSSRARLDLRLASDSRHMVADSQAARECDEADHVFFFVYLAPEFWRLADAVLAIRLPQEVPAVIDQSYAFRQLLWERLPRCDDALEMGWLMRSAAADAVAMLALELADAPVWDIPYLPRIAGDINQFSELARAFISPCGKLDGATKTYYVVAENIANIRACASTACAIVTTAVRGQRLDVADDMSNWYEIVMPNCESAFIAGFLASQTPPG